MAKLSEKNQAKKRWAQRLPNDQAEVHCDVNTMVVKPITPDLVEEFPELAEKPKRRGRPKKVSDDAEGTPEHGDGGDGV